jgi:hypothetical protein
MDYHLREGRCSRVFVHNQVPQQRDLLITSAATICECFGYDAFIVQRGETIAALPAIAALGKNTRWGTEIESRNVLFLPR